MALKLSRCEKASVSSTSSVSSSLSLSSTSTSSSSSCEAGGGGCVNERCGGGLHQIPADRSIISFMAMAYEFSSPVLHPYIYL